MDKTTLVIGAKSMDSQRWQQIQKIFDHIVDKTPSHRRDYLAMVCEENDELRLEVEGLLRANDEAEKAPWTPQSDMTEELPSIPGYIIHDELGRGGMGIVYRATDQQGREVALKVLPSYLIHDVNARGRFEQEANALSAVDHVSICRVYQAFSTEEQQPCIAMELCIGETLEEYLEKGAVGYRRCVSIIKKLAEGLAEAHQQHIFHRDIKPSNIILTDDLQLKLIDFGIAKIADIRLTVTGTVIGSPKYMSPEQWRGEKIDQCADLWSLGIIAFEILFGKYPFDADSRTQLALAILNEPLPPLPEFSSDGVSLVELQKIILKLLEKNAQDRYQRCEELVEQLSAL